MSLFGIILALFLIYFIIKNRKDERLFKDIYLISILSLIFLDVGYFAKIGSFTLEYNYLFSALNFVFAFFAALKFPFPKKQIKLFLGFILFLIVNMAIPLALHIGCESVSAGVPWDDFFIKKEPLEMVFMNTKSFFILFRVFIALFSFSVFVNLFTKDDLLRYMRIIYKLSYIVIALAVVELIVSNFIDKNLFRNVVLDIFGHSDATYVDPRQFLGIYQPLVFKREPSSFGYMLFIICVNNIILHYKDKNHKMLIPVVASLVLLICSKSVSSYVYIVVLAFVFINFKHIKINKIYYVLICAIALVLVLNSKGSLIGRVNEILDYLPKIWFGTPADLPVSSGIIRFYSMANNIKVFLSRPFIGAGLGIAYSFSSIITMLCNIGLVGVALYFLFIRNQTNVFFKTDFTSYFTILIIFLSHIITGHMSQILYLETIFVLILELKYGSILKRGNRINENNVYNLSI